MQMLRRIRITKLLRQLQSVDAGLRALVDNKTALPSPREMEALEAIRYILRQLPERAETCEAEFWSRINLWRQTPYSPPQRLWRNIIGVVAGWLFGILAIYNAVLWPFASFFPERWHVLVLSAVLSFTGVVLIVHSERKH